MADDSAGDDLPPDAGDVAKIVRLLSSREAYTPQPEAVERIETHGALVFLAGELAYKMKRPVKFSYMDFSSPEKRRRALERELEINRPHAGEIYLGLETIVRGRDGSLHLGGEGEPVEWVLKMRRFGANDLLSQRVAAGGLETRLWLDLADAVWHYHETAHPDPAADTPGSMRAIVEEITEALQKAPVGTGDTAIDRFAARATSEIERTRALLERRSAAGLVRRCHGDLHLGNIVVWKGRPTLFDALEFDERLATIDTLYDLAFLIMDLVHRGERAPANVVLNRYLQHSVQDLDIDGLAALPLFLALRAGVRAMVSAQRALLHGSAAAAGPISTSDPQNEARSYLDDAIGHLAPAPPLLVAVGGLSGTGKSTLGQALAPELGRAPGAVHLRSDVERKLLFGRETTERLPESSYMREVTEKVYARLHHKARLALAAGAAVVLDAVHGTLGEREAAERIAKDLGVRFTGLWLEAPAAVMMERTAARRGDASDATPDIVARQLDYDIGPIRWSRIPSGGNLEPTIAAARRALDPPRSMRPLP